MEPHVQNVAVVGGGIVGICSALSLLEAGQTVTLIERAAPGQATSFGNAGVISPWSIVPQAMPGIWKQLPGMLLRPTGPAGVSLRHGLGYLPWLKRFLAESRVDNAMRNSDAMHLLCADTVTLYRQLLEGTGHENLIADSMYVHAFRNKPEADIDSLGFQMRRAKHATLECINAADLHDLEPDLAQKYAAAILIKGQARARNPGKIGEVLAQKFQQLGGTVLQTTVTALRPSTDRWQVVTEIGSATFDKVVLAAGIWSAKLLRPLGIKIPLAAERGYHVAYPDTELMLNNSIMDISAHVVASSMEGGLRVAGIAEFAGVDTPENPRRLKSLQRTAEFMFPALKELTPKTWMGTRPSFPDSLPIIQEFTGHPGLIGAFGHSHYGLMMAPKTGRIAADIAVGKSINIDLSPFSADRF